MGKVRLTEYERRELNEKIRKAKERVGAVTRGELDALQGAARKLFNRVLASKLNGLTDDDLLTIFVKPEHHEMMRVAPAIIDDCSVGGWFQHRVNGVDVDISPTIMPYAYPKNMGMCVYNDGEAYQKLRTWLRWRTEAGKKWGLVDATLVELCCQCKDLQTVRFFWPALVALCTHVRSTAFPKLDPDKVRDFKVPSDLPLLTQGLKAALAETCETVAVSLMLPAEDLEQPIRLSVTSTALPNFVTPWGEGKASY